MPATSKPLFVALAAALMIVPACGDDSLDDPSGGGLSGGGDLSGGDLADLAEDAGLTDDAEEFAEALNDATGAGGGGTLHFDGEAIPIASATCILDDDTFDVGTVSDNQFRVFVTKNRPDSEVSVQILDADSVQWFPKDVSGDEAVRAANLVSSGLQPYFNNVDDRVVEARFTVSCP